MRRIGLVLFLGGVCLVAGLLPRAASPTKVVLIGIDGFGWQEFSRRVKAGGLPHLRRLAEQGVVGRLTAYPGGQEDQWRAIATGLRPIVTNPSGWWGRKELGGPPLHDRILAPFPKVAPRPFWEFLSLTSVPVAISGWELGPSSDGPGMRARFVALGRGGVAPGASPEKLWEKRAAPNWVATAYAQRELGLIQPPSLGESIAGDIRWAESRPDTQFEERIPALRSIRREKPGLYLDLKYALVSTLVSGRIGQRFVSETDRGFVSVVLWGLDPLFHRSQSGFPELLDQSLEFMDQEVGKVLNKIGPNALVFVVSNHGMTHGHASESTDALFIASGPNVKKAKQLVGGTLTDIAPTLLRAFGIQLSDRLDGRPMEHLFTHSFLRDHPIQKTYAWASLPKAKEFSPINQGLLKQVTMDRMKRIGYFKNLRAGVTRENATNE